MLICIFCDEKARGKCKTVDESEVKLRNHIGYHVCKTWSSMSTDPFFWCGNI